MKNLLLLIVLSLFFCLSAIAKTVRLTDFGAIANDPNPDDQAMRLAINDLHQAGGGTIIFPDGKIVLSTAHSFGLPDKFINFRLQGDKNSVIEVAGVWLLFNFGNTPQVEIDGLTFVGRNVPVNHPDFTDAQLAIIYTPSAQQLKIKNSQFFGLRSNDSIVKAGNGDIYIENVQFEGNSASIANISVFGPYQRGLTVIGSVFSDYANWQNQYLSKSPYGNGTWIKVAGARVPIAANGQRQVRIEDCRFDEGAHTGVFIADVFAAYLSGLAFNVAGTDSGNGITFNNVEYGEVRGSWFGWTGFQRPAIVALNNSMVEATGIKLASGVYLGNYDSTSQIEMRACNSCQTRQLF